MATWPVSPETPHPQAPTDTDELRGRDIKYMRGDMVVTPAGDWAVVEGVDAIRQSVLHEALTSPGEFVFRPEYGMGLAALVKGPLSRAALDAAQNRIRERLTKNPRIARVREALLERVDIDGRSGLRVVIRADGLDGQDLGIQPIVIGESFSG